MSSSTATPLAQYASSLRLSGTGASLGLERTCWPSATREIFHMSTRVHVRVYVKRCIAFNYFQGPLVWRGRLKFVWIRYGRPIPLVSMSDCFSPSVQKIYRMPTFSKLAQQCPMSVLLYVKAVELQNLFKAVFFSNYVAVWVGLSSMWVDTGTACMVEIRGWAFSSL